MKAPTPMQKVSGGPTFCHECNRQLQRAPGRGMGLFYAHVIKNRMSGTLHRVHGDCLPVIWPGKGYDFVRPDEPPPSDR